MSFLDLQNISRALDLQSGYRNTSRLSTPPAQMCGKHLIFCFPGRRVLSRQPSAEDAFHLTFRADGRRMCGTTCPHIACIGRSSGTCESHNWSIAGSGDTSRTPASSNCDARIPLPPAARGSVAAQVHVHVFDALAQRSELGALLLGSNWLQPTKDTCTGAHHFLPIWSHKHSKSDVSNDMSYGCTPKTIAP